MQTIIVNEKKITDVTQFKKCKIAANCSLHVDIKGEVSLPTALKIHPFQYISIKWNGHNTSRQRTRKTTFAPVKTRTKHDNHNHVNQKLHRPYRNKTKKYSWQTQKFKLKKYCFHTIFIDFASFYAVYANIQDIPFLQCTCIVWVNETTAVPFSFAFVFTAVDSCSFYMSWWIDPFW